MTFRPAILRRALEHIDAHPDEWNQSTWISASACGTVACLAGRIVLQSDLEEGCIYSYPEAALGLLGLPGVNHSMFNASNGRAALAIWEASLNGDRVRLPGADLTDADLFEIDLTGADLREADLTDANLREANLHRANLAEANLTDADLTGANLAEANLTDADLTDADLRWTNLTGANLTGANLTGANLDYAYTSGTIGLD